MPTPHIARTTSRPRITNRINKLPIHLLLVCAFRKTGARIGFSSRSQVSAAMRDGLDYRSAKGRALAPRAVRLTSLALLLALAVPSTARTPTLSATPPPPTQPLPWRDAGERHALPPADGFDVALFEAMAEQLVQGQRIPGMAMAIVQGGRVLSARGYGVTDVARPEPVDAHTVFRLASLSKAFAGTMTGLLVNDGSLRWDSKVADYVPGFNLAEETYTRQVTVTD